MVFVDYGWDLQPMVLFNCEGHDGELMDEDWSTCSIHELLDSIQGVWRWNSLVSWFVSNRNSEVFLVHIMSFGTEVGFKPHVADYCNLYL